MFRTITIIALAALLLAGPKWPAILAMPVAQAASTTVEQVAPCCDEGAVEGMSEQAQDKAQDKCQSGCAVLPSTASILDHRAGREGAVFRHDDGSGFEKNRLKRPPRTTL